MAKINEDVDPYKGEREGKLREVGNQAVWSLSSCKPGMWHQIYNLTYATSNFLKENEYHGTVVNRSSKKLYLLRI